MATIENPEIGIYEFEFSDITGGFTKPNNQIITHATQSKSTVNAEYKSLVKPIDILSGQADLSISVEYSLNNGPYITAPSDLLNNIKIIEYDYTNSEDRMSNIMINPISQLKQCKTPMSISDFNKYFTNIASEYYYLFRINEISGYSLTNHADIIYKYVKKDQPYELELKFIKTVSDYICFEIPIVTSTGVTSIDTFDLNLVSGYSEDVVEYNETYNNKIRFNGDITTIGSRKSILSNIYSATTLFGTNTFGWIKPESKTITYSDSQTTTVLTISNNSRNCSDNIESRIISNTEVTVVKNLGRIINSAN